jgi:glycosyltransferase involved in cell wall biosynthesis
MLGLMHGPDKTVPTPAEDWRQATVDVVVPALNEEEYIVLVLSSIARQTLQPRKVILVDDGSRDNTAEYARKFGEFLGMELEVIKRAKPIGKTPTVKRESREDDADVELILDGDTVFESDNYIERLVQELYQGVGIASACGVILPMRERDHKNYLATPRVAAFMEQNPEVSIGMHTSPWQRLMRGITNMYRGVLYMFLQRFIYHGQMVFFGSIINPVGCAVAYRRKYVQELFDRFEPELGDDLTNSEDIFMGFAFLEQGYRNVQLTDVVARSVEPQVDYLPTQLYMWSSSFLQSCYYFDDLIRGPFKSLKRALLHRGKPVSAAEQAGVEKRKIKEAYRQRFGVDHTQAYGRPMGWVLLLSLVEKIFFPTVLILLMVIGAWQPLGLTVAIETVISLIILAIISQGQRFEMVVKGLLITPLRYASLLFDAVTIGRFAGDLWFTKQRQWRK